MMELFLVGIGGYLNSPSMTTSVPEHDRCRECNPPSEVVELEMLSRLKIELPASE